MIDGKEEKGEREERSSDESLVIARNIQDRIDRSVPIPGKEDRWRPVRGIPAAPVLARNDVHDDKLDRGNWLAKSTLWKRARDIVKKISKDPRHVDHRGLDEREKSFSRKIYGFCKTFVGEI